MIVLTDKYYFKLPIERGDIVSFFDLDLRHNTTHADWLPIMTESLGFNIYCSFLEKGHIDNKETLDFTVLEAVSAK